MGKNNLRNSFIRYCEQKKFEKNLNQVKIIELLDDFIKPKNFFFDLIFRKNKKLCFYLYGGVGVGKTMIFNHLYEQINIPKLRLHFNEFMIKFHDFRYQNKENSITSFVKKLKKNRLIYLDELQVTNIVDAMILGKLFDTIFQENILVLITSNTKIDDLYKDGLQREQFLPFISVIKKHSVQKELFIEEDYRVLTSKKLKTMFFPINEKTKFKINLLFRKLTKGKNCKKAEIDVKGRTFLIPQLFDGIAKFDFNKLCGTNLGAEDYLELSKICNFIVIENIPVFNDYNANQQKRFITLIDILYEKRIFLIVSMENSLEKIGSSQNLVEPFKRTLSRLHELTSPNTLF